MSFVDNHKIFLQGSYPHPADRVNINLWRGFRFVHVDTFYLTRMFLIPHAKGVPYGEERGRHSKSPGAGMLDKEEVRDLVNRHVNSRYWESYRIGPITEKKLLPDRGDPPGRNTSGTFSYR